MRTQPARSTVEHSYLPTVSGRLAAACKPHMKEVRRLNRQGRRAEATRSHRGGWKGYARISVDRFKGADEREAELAGKGVARQEIDGDLVATLKQEPGDGPLEWFVDNNISGGDFAPRPQFDALLESVAAGETAVIVTDALDRLSREPLEQAELLLICEYYRVRIITGEGADIDWDDPDVDTQLAMAGVRNVMGRWERATTQRRTGNEKHASAKAGAYNGGRRCFGYEADGVTINPVEAALIREAITRVIAGAGVTTIQNDWHRRGVPTASGSASWNHNVVKRMLLSPRLIGKRTHHGEIVADAQWPPIISWNVDPTADEYCSEHDYRTLQRLLSGHSAAGAPRSYMLTGGLLHCALCQKPLRSRARSGGIRSYACLSSPPNGGCGKIKVKAEPLEKAVSQLFFNTLDTLAYRDIKAEHQTRAARVADLMAGIAEDEALISSFADLYGDKTMSRADYLSQTVKVQGRVAENRRRLSEIPDAADIVDLVDGRAQLRADWDHEEMPMIEKRTAIALILEYVPIGPAVKGRNYFEVSRIGEPIWKV